MPGANILSEMSKAPETERGELLSGLVYLREVAALPVRECCVVVGYWSDEKLQF
jgi:hypothetical protein